MELYSSIALDNFVDLINGFSTSEKFNIKAFNLLHTIPEKEYMYGLSLLRRAISLYEDEKNIPIEKSKKDMPFFRDNSRMLVGPEIGLFTITFNESPISLKSLNPVLSLSWDYEKLTENCLLENIFMVRCKYDTDKIIHTFKNQLEREYDKFFFDDEHTGFKTDSRFFSMLCNACLEVRKPKKAEEKEWRLLELKPYEEAFYHYEDNTLTPYVPITLPKDCLKQITLLNAPENPLLYGTLAGFLKRVGLSPEIYLNGMQD